MGNAASIGREIRRDLSNVMARVMLLAEYNLENSTPVDTTNAANNWILSVRTPFEGVDGSRALPSRAAQLDGIEAVKNFDVGRDAKIFLRNNVLYLQFLDEGSSPQADAGFVAEGFAAAVRGAPHGRKTAVRKMLSSMAKVAYQKGW